jgi:hypothetical protein
VAAGGRYMLDGPQLQRLRQAIASAESGEQLVAIVANLSLKGYEIHGEELKRACRPPSPPIIPAADCSATSG